MSFPRISKLKTSNDFRNRLKDLYISMPFDETLESGAQSPLGKSVRYKSKTIGNRFCILPMEGWDGTTDGRPSEFTIRRWKNFGLSGAKLIWGGEAVAVRHDGRANPNQLLINESNLSELAALRNAMLDSHRSKFGSTDDLFDGLQITHSGRFARPNHTSKLEPRTAYQHPVLDQRFGVEAQQAVLSDDELRVLIGDF
ncbi:MAG: hypothetical protein P1U70_20700, partial [Saprospiraceae bacterium]|nr:hypothetical protein [Saprospiraceae bacterium]